MSAHREPIPADWTSLPDFRPDPQRLAQGSELAQKLLQALVELPRQQAEAFCLRYLAVNGGPKSQRLAEVCVGL